MSSCVSSWPALGALALCLVVSSSSRAEPAAGHGAGPLGMPSGMPVAAGPVARPEAVEGPPPELALTAPPRPALSYSAWSPGSMTAVERVNPRRPGAMVTPVVGDEPPDAVRHFKHVFGLDDRVRVADTTLYPQRTVAQIFVRWGADWFSCSGAVVRPIWVMTAGHCIYNHDLGGWADELIIAPGRDGGVEPFGRWDWQRVITVEGWSRDANHDFDVGVIEARGAIGERVGYLGFRRETDEALWQATLHTAGYPFDGNVMYAQTCGISDQTRWQVSHRCDTDGGQAGSAMWVEDADRQVVAVHTGSSDIGPPLNVAARLSEEIYAWLVETFDLCANACAFGSSMCGAGGERLVCRGAADGCTDWLAAPCAAGAACVGGACACADDAFEPNDDPERGRPLVPGVYGDLAICGGNDDWYVVELRQGERLRVQLDISAAAGDLDLGLFDEAGGVLATSAGTGDREVVEALAERDGTWRLRVYGFADAAGSYTLSVERTTGAPAGWQCAAVSYGGGDGCDCACGVPDPDCGAREVDAVGCGGDEICVAGRCVCQADCAGRACGEGDGCGGLCMVACEGDPAPGEMRDGGGPSDGPSDGPGGGSSAGADGGLPGGDGGPSGDGDGDGGGGGGGGGGGCGAAPGGGAPTGGLLAVLALLAVGGRRRAR